MNLREKVIEGFVATYTENEKVIIRNLLQTGRIDEEEWSQISQELTQLAHEYQDGDKDSNEFIKERRKIRKKFNRPREEKQPGLTREEAEDLYHEIGEEQRETMEEAFAESNHSSLRITAKILSARIKFILARLKNI